MKFTFFDRIRSRSTSKSKEQSSAHPTRFSIDKRQKFVISVVFLSFGLFFAEFIFGKSGLMFVYIALVLSALTDVFLLWAIYRDAQESSSRSVYILPFFYSLAFGLFYFLVPARILSRVVLTSLYAFGLYSLLLSQNIFVVAATRTIALLSGARIVSFVITLVSYFFLANIIYTMHLPGIITSMIIFLLTYILVFHSLWTYTLQRPNNSPIVIWTLGLTLCLTEATLALWFWPSSPTVIALFLTGFFYTTVGLAHMWLEKRLFKGVLWEYVWVGAFVFFMLLLLSSWGK